MKKLFTSCCLLALLGLGVLFTGFESVDTLPTAQIRDWYARQMEETWQQSEQFMLLLEQPAEPAVLRYAFAEWRKSYKKSEILLDYLDPEVVKMYLNGAPLLSLEPNAAQLMVLEPEGLQVLDEMLFAADEVMSIQEIKAMVLAWQQHFRIAKGVQQTIPISDREIFEASRMALIRTFSLSFTGFDTPGSLNGFGEAGAVMEALEEMWQPYLTALSRKDKAMAKDMEKLFRIGKEWCEEQQNFEEADRIKAYKFWLAPLYNMMVQVQATLGIETWEESVQEPQPLASGTTHLFDENFFNTTYFSGVKRSPQMPAKIKLGRTLFFDPILSGNNQRACASCHHADKAFTDQLVKSNAFDFQGQIERNSPTVIDAVFAAKYFYDLRLEDLQRQSEHVIFHSQEFNTDMFTLLEKLSSSGEYVDLFTQAYPEAGKKPISVHTFSDALTAYVASLTSFNSSFDQYMRGDSDTLSQLAYDGFNLFMGKAACGTCHFAPTFSGLVPPHFKDSESEVLGVPSVDDNSVLDADPGRGGGKNLREYADHLVYSFKTTTVRNTALTAPYMHNGVFGTLQEVLAFYNNGGGIGLGLDVPYQTLPGDSLHLNSYELSALEAFIQSLTDTTGVTQKPATLPKYTGEWSHLNQRVIGGEY